MEYSGHHLKRMMLSATSWLEKAVPQIDALNVFPVPDGDTGTNMFLTMRSVLDELSFAGDGADEVAMAIAQGALMGARGNSGVILSQIYKGLAEALKGKKTFTPLDLAQGLKEGSKLAYKAISQPVEGTMLTVIREVAEASYKAALDGSELTSVLEATVEVARDAVRRTPSLLPILSQAGVVDAGGQGLYTILEGMLRFLKGEGMEGEPEILSPSVPVSGIGIIEEESYGYCTEFLIKGKELRPERIRRGLENKGTSIMVAGDESVVRVHIHTFDPGRVLRFALRFGTLHEIQIRNMDEQRRLFEAKRRILSPPLPIAIVAVASGEGLIKLFKGLGASVVVHGGKTMNPSIRELFQAIESVPSENVILLPNNKNVLLTAQQASALSSKKVRVVPTKSIPQGIAAIIAFNQDKGLEENAQIMEKEKERVKTVEITRAVRSTQILGLRIERKQAIAFIDGELVATKNTIIELVKEILPKLGLERAEVVTIFYGAEAESMEMEEIKKLFQKQCKNVEVVDGGQPYYNYIISIE